MRVNACMRVPAIAWPRVGMGISQQGPLATSPQRGGGIEWGGDGMLVMACWWWPAGETHST